MKISKINREQSEEIMNQTLFQHIDQNTVVKMGFVQILPGERVPKEGLSMHDEDEYSFILQGSITTQSGDSPIMKVEHGTATFIPAKEKHWAINEGEEVCEIVYVLVEHK